jgi:release factor glutamine methyltransferase
MRRSAGSVSELLSEGTTRLKQAGSESPGLDAEILLRLALNATRVQLFDALPYPVKPSASRRYRELIEQRANGIPIAYITGHREFYGHEFIVNEHVLVPRPETEFLVEFALAWLRDRGDIAQRIVDIGTGSGAIAISVALETNNRHTVIGSEVSPEALEVARLNRDALRAKVELVEGSLLNPVKEPVDLILANLPYLRTDQAHAGIEHEPSIALYAGDDGFTLIRQLLEEAPPKLNTGGAIILELDPDQSELALSAGQDAFPEAEVQMKADLAGTNRYLIITTR